MKFQHQLLLRLTEGEALEQTPELLALIAEYNLEVTEQGESVCITRPLELLDPSVLQQGISDRAKTQLSNLDLHWSLASTNTFVLDLAKDKQFHGYACMAEQQTAGKGRRGRNWVSPFGKNIYLSLGWKLPVSSSLDGLSLAVGCACARAIRSVSAGVDVKLKWPNDLLIAQAKAGGILVELGQGGTEFHHVVIGVGINLQLSEKDSGGIDQPWSIVRGVSRNALAAGLLNQLTESLVDFSKQGFAGFQSEWNSLDNFAGETVRLINVGGDTDGIARGVDSSGNLLLEVEGELRKINAGEVSLRASKA